MKNFLLTAIIWVFLSFSGISQNYEIYIDTISHDGMVGNTDLTGFTTYKVFARTQDPSVFVSAVIGDAENPVSITTSTSFFQSEFGGLTGGVLNPQIFSFSPETEYDSFVTIGYSDSDNYGVPFVENTEGAIPSGVNTEVAITVEDPGNGWVDQFNSGGDIIIDTPVGGAWLVVPTGNAGYPQGMNNSVLVGQFTTNGDFSACLNYIVISNVGTPEQSGHEEHGRCASSSTYGCTDSLACNFDSDAESDDFSCYYIGDTCKTLIPAPLEMLC